MSLVRAISIHSLSSAKSHLLLDGLNRIGDKDVPQIQHSFTFTEKIKIFMTNITIEPIVLLCLLAHSLATLTIKNLVLEKGCRVNRAFGDEVCDALSTRNQSYPRYKEHEQQVQILAASMFVWKYIVMSLMPAVLLLFIGSWSDRHKKRKQIILNNVLENIATFIVFLICTYYFYQIPLEVVLLAEALPPIFTGGVPASGLGVYCYLSGISDEKTRTIRLGALQVSVTFIMCIGNLLSGILFQKLGFYGVFSLSLILFSTAYFYGQCYVKDIWMYEAKKGIVTEVPKKPFLLDLFDLRHVSQTFRVLYKKRENNGRKKICFILLLVILMMGPVRGEVSIVYYYMKYRFGWSSVDYSLFFTYQFVSFVLGNMIGLLLFTKFFQIDDCLLGILSCISRILANLLYSLGPSPIYMYAGATADIFSSMFMTVLRSVGSKLVPSEELGKFYSLFALSETIAPLIFCPLYNTIYAATLGTIPGAIFLTSNGLLVPTILIFIWLHLQLRRDKNEIEGNVSTEEKQPLPTDET